MISSFPEIETVLDDWVRLRKSTMRTRHLPESIILQLYTPPHSQIDPLTPLQWRKKALKEKWSGLILDTDVQNGAAMLGLCSCKNISYIGIVHNYRHRMAFERLTNILGLRATWYASLTDIPTNLLQTLRVLRESKTTPSQ